MISDMEINDLTSLSEKMVLVIRAIPAGDNIITNPYLPRIMELIHDLYLNDIKASSEEDKEMLKGELTIIYQAATMLDETITMLERTADGHQLLIDRLKNLNERLKHALTSLEGIVTDQFGKYDAFFIITPEFQSLAHLWWRYLENVKEGKSV